MTIDDNTNESFLFSSFMAFAIIPSNNKVCLKMATILGNVNDY